MSKVILTGNGLSVGLNKEFSLESITERFYTNLPNEYKDFIKHHIDKMNDGNYDQRDFEDGIASIEQVHDSLNSYVEFLNQKESGQLYLETAGLSSEDLDEHLKTINKVILTYTSTIAEIIDGNVRWDQINEKLGGFLNWVGNQCDQGDDIDLFTLNFDLLLETILLQILGRNRFTDFHVKRGYSPTGDDKFNFDPLQAFSDYGAMPIRLHHLHGSLSSFKRLRDGRVFKMRTEDIRLSDVYTNIVGEQMFPSIITGGYKSEKIQRTPFNFYYTKFKEKMINEDNLCDEIYIIGYSFRDEHINEALSERLKLSRGKNPKKINKLVIVDYKSPEEQQKFIDDVNKALGLGKKTKLTEEEAEFIFTGANDIDQLI